MGKSGIPAMQTERDSSVSPKAVTSGGRGVVEGPQIACLSGRSARFNMAHQNLIAQH
jgi:hypothetical protein